MSILKKISIFILISISFIVGILIIIINNTIGDYDLTIYHMFINPILFFIYILAILLLKAVLKKSINNKLYLFFLTPIFIFIGFYFWKKNFHKNIILSGYIEKDYGSNLKLYDDKTFEIKIQYSHHYGIKKGDFYIVRDRIKLNRKDIVNLTKANFTNEYRLENNKFLIPLDKKFETIIVSLKDN